MIVLSFDSERKEICWGVYACPAGYTPIEVGPNTNCLWLEGRLGIPMPPAGRIELMAMAERL